MVAASSSVGTPRCGVIARAERAVRFSEFTRPIVCCAADTRRGQRSALSLPIGLVVICLLSSTLVVLSADPSASGIEFFERKVRPLLAENCFSCHGEEKQKAKLRLDSPAAIRAGGESGAI